MAALDIMPLNSSQGGHTRVVWGQMETGESFLTGEPVYFNAAGQIAEPPTDPPNTEVIGIALAPSGSGAGFENPRTGVATAGDDPIPVVIGDDDTLFVARNFSVLGSAFGDTAPAITNIGDEAGLALIGDDWGVDISLTTNPVVRIVDVLDANNDSINFTNGTTGVKVVFKFIGGLWHTDATPAA